MDTDLRPLAPGPGSWLPGRALHQAAREHLSTQASPDPSGQGPGVWGEPSGKGRRQKYELKPLQEEGSREQGTNRAPREEGGGRQGESRRKKKGFLNHENVIV